MSITPTPRLDSGSQRTRAACRRNPPTKTLNRANNLRSGWSSKVVTPLDRRSKGSLSLGSVSAPDRQKTKPACEPPQERLRRKGTYSSSSKLDCERNALDPTNDRCDRRRVLRRDCKCSFGCLRRAQNSCTASTASTATRASDSGSKRGGTSYKRSPWRWSASRLVMSTRILGDARRSSRRRMRRG